MADEKKRDYTSSLGNLFSDFFGDDAGNFFTPGSKKPEPAVPSVQKDPLDDFREINDLMDDLKQNMILDGTLKPAELKPETPAAPAEGPQPEQTAEAQETAAQEEQPKEPETDPKEDLEKLVGLTDLKKDVEELISLVRTQKLREEKGMKVVPVSKHLVFTGNPGTGKTTVARILARLYKQVGVLSKGQLVEVDRSGLVAGFVGQTAMKTQEKITEAMGGVLFIDEAYTLSGGGDNDFGQESIDTILKAMEDHRDDFVVIVAGYPDLMERFINSNPGLKSRFNKYFFFPDYTAEELIKIFESQYSRYDYRMTDEAKKLADDYLVKMEQEKDDNFANARDVRNFFEKLVARQASRIAKLEAPTEEDLATLTKEDVESVLGIEPEESGEPAETESAGKPEETCEKPEESAAESQE